MRRLRHFKWLPAAVAALWPAIGMAVEPAGPDVDGQQETIRKLRQTRAELHQLRDEASGNWLNQQRVEEVKAPVQEVLADADTRASLLEGGMVAGHNGKSFFLSNDDGSFLLKIAGQIQLRYIANFRNDDPDTSDNIDEGEGGYNIPMGATSVEPFARYERLDFDTAITDTSGADDEVDLLTFGVNWYLTQHAAKFTADLVWALDPLPINQEGLGLLADDGDEDDQVALRLQFQFQLLF